MHKSFLRKVALALATVMAVAFLPSAFAQITTTGITGSLRAADGKALAGVTVTATHNPTNANYTAVTTPAGRFNFIGLPVGGPFTLSAKTEGGEAVATDQFTTLGTDIDVALTVKSETIQLEKVVVGGSRSALDATATGSGVTLDAAQLAVKPTTERSFADLVSAAPQVTLQALSSANDREEAHIVALGQNNRFNSFMIDGARINDVFGLNGTGLAAFFNPISVDALNQMSVKVSPYDANYSFFTGAAINAVTKSGTNTFHGSAYYIFKGDHLFGIQMQGENPKEYDATGVKIVPRLDRETKGFTFSGPIWKDHIFFFVNYEKYSSISNGRQLTFTPDAGIETSILARLKQYSSTVNWGDPVTQATTNAQSEKKTLAKLDWNISDKHRFSARYSKTDGLVPQFGNLGSGVTTHDQRQSGGERSKRDAGQGRAPDAQRRYQQEAGRHRAGGGPERVGRIEHGAAARACRRVGREPADGERERRAQGHRRRQHQHHGDGHAHDGEQRARRVPLEEVRRQLHSAIAGHDREVTPVAALGADPAVADGDGPAQPRADLAVVGDHDDRGASLGVDGLQRVHDLVLHGLALWARDVSPGT